MESSDRNDEAASHAKTTLRREVQELLKADDARSIHGSLGLFVMGAGACLVAGFTFATIVTFVLYMMAGTSALGWFGWFSIYLIIVGVFVYRYGKHLQRGFVLESLSADATAETQRVYIGEPRISNPVAWLPFAIVTGLAGVRRNWSARQSAVFNRAAEFLIDVAKQDGGSGVRQLMHPPENMPIFTSAADWLERNDWVGKSSDGDRFYISTAGQKRLVAVNLMPKQSLQVR